MDKKKIDAVVNALWNKTAKLFHNPNDGEVSCKIGEYWFYFLGFEDEDYSIEEVHKNYDVFTVAEMILEAIEGLEDNDEQNYYYSLLHI